MLFRSLGREAQQAAEDALAVLARADERIGARGGYLNHVLIRSESVSSSWIEGNSISPKKLAIAELLQQGQSLALDVVANVRATEEAIAELADWNRPVSTGDEHRADGGTGSSKRSRRPLRAATLWCCRSLTRWPPIRC